MLRLMPRAWQYSAVFVREEDSTSTPPLFTHLSMFHVKHTPRGDEVCNVSRETLVLPEWFVKGSVPLTEPAGFDVEESKVSILP